MIGIFLRVVRGGWSHAFDGDDFAYRVRKSAGISQRDHTAQRMADKGKWPLADHIAERGQIENVLGYRIDRTWRPLAVAMTAEVECENVIVVAQRARHPVPTASMIQPAVNEHHWRFVVAPVIPVVQLQAVRIKKERKRF